MNPIDPEIGFTSDVITDPERFVGRRELIQQTIRSINTKTSLIGVYGKRGVGKSSLLRQLQQMALGDYALIKKAGLQHELPDRIRRYLTVFYTCDALIKDGEDLLSRLCNDQDSEDGLTRLVPNEGKELEEFSRTKEVQGGSDLKVVSWGAKGTETSKYANKVPGDIVQTFRNYIGSALTHQVEKRMKRDGLLIFLDEIDVIQDKSGLGSLIKSLSSEKVKFAISGIGDDLTELVSDHKSVERLLEQGTVHVRPMDPTEIRQIIDKAEYRFERKIIFNEGIKSKIVNYSEGYPYFAQLIGRSCVENANELQSKEVNNEVFKWVLEDIKSGKAFPTLEAEYQRAIGKSPERQWILHLLAEQSEDNTLFWESIGRIALKDIRKDADDLSIKHIDQLVPRLLDQDYGPVLRRLD